MKKSSLIGGMFAALLALLLAAPAAFADKDKDEESQVTLCHYPPGNPDNPQTLTVGASAVDAHLSEHGDTLGACPEEDKDKDDESKDKDDESKDDESKDDESKDDESKDKDDESKDDGEGKTTICHDGSNTLSVDDSAVAGHLGHGDYLGECTCACPPGAASCVCADGKDGVTSPATTTPPSSQRDIRGQ